MITLGELNGAIQATSIEIQVLNPNSRSLREYLEIEPDPASVPHEYPSGKQLLFAGPEVVHSIKLSNVTLRMKDLLFEIISQIAGPLPDNEVAVIVAVSKFVISLAKLSHLSVTDNDSLVLRAVMKCEQQREASTVAGIQSRILGDRHIATGEVEKSLENLTRIGVISRTDDKWRLCERVVWSSKS